MNKITLNNEVFIYLLLEVRNISGFIIVKIQYCLNNWIVKMAAAHDLLIGWFHEYFDTANLQNWILVYTLYS